MRIVPLLLSAIILISCNVQTSVPDNDKLKVAASFYPLAEFARQVGGDLVDVITITPAGMEPHDYEPTPRDIAAIQAARVFLFNGAGVDGWAESVSESALPDIHVIEVSQHVDLLPGQMDDHEEQEGEEYEESEWDPHIWLDPSLAQQIVSTIARTFGEADSAHAAIYQANAKRYHDGLATLDTDFRTGLMSCEKRDFITSHAAFGYLAKRYALKQMSIAGLSPEEEPSAKTLGEIADFAKKEGIDTIFFEELVSPKLAETIASEIGAKTAVLNPLEGLTKEQIAAGADYLSVMRQNLENLRGALHCQ